MSITSMNRPKFQRNGNWLGSSDTYICTDRIDHRLSRKWLGTDTGGITIRSNATLMLIRPTGRNKLQWNFHQNFTFLCQENVIVLCNAAAVLSQPRCVKWGAARLLYLHQPPETVVFMMQGRQTTGTKQKNPHVGNSEKTSLLIIAQNLITVWRWNCQ